jgi:hypothetical protein
MSLFCTKLCALCGYFHSTEHVTKDYPDLLETWEEKKAHCNMVTAKLHEDHKS